MASMTGISRMMCLCLNFVMFLLHVLPVTYSKSVLTVPHDAEPGYFITKLACSRPDVKIKTFGETSGDFHDKFHITGSGVLVVKTEVLSSINKSFYFTAFKTSPCYDNVKNHDNFIIRVQDSHRLVHFSKRQYTFNVLPNSQLEGETISYVHDIKIPESDLQFSLEGVKSHLFQVVPVSPGGLEIQVTEQFEISRFQVFQLRLLATGTHVTVGGVDIEIILAPRVQTPRSRVIVTNNDLVASFDQKTNDGGRLESKPHHRLRRQAVQTLQMSYSVNETVTGRLFTIDPALPQGTTYTFNLTSATPEDIFVVDNDGHVYLKGGAKLQYDFDGPRTHTIYVDVLSGNQVVRKVEVTLNVLNVNDEVPYFTTKPTPYLATIPEEADAALNVFQIQAMDPDNGSVVYYIDGLNENFDVQLRTGWIVTTKRITTGTNFTVRLYAEDSSASVQQRTNTVTVDIRRGPRKPQFLSESYFAEVEEVNVADQADGSVVPQNSFETTDKQGNKVPIRAINFQEKLGGTLQYTIYENSVTRSTRFAVDNGNLKTLQPLDYETDAHQFPSLTIMAIDSQSGLSNTASLVITVVDKNEYDPLFSKSTYTAYDVRETLPLGSVVTTVTATDRDANTNISYSVTNPLFTVQSIDNGKTGNVVVNGELDYDKTVGNRYEFDVIATDNGKNPYPRNATARIVVYLRNENDQSPKFDDNLVTTLVDNTKGGETVITVRATDEDGDRVTYSFQGGSNIYDIFEIQPNTGNIILRQGFSIPSSGTDRYQLPIVAKDDGSCCGMVQTRSSNTTVTINIIDAVNRKPSFVNCGTYKPEVAEEQEPGAFVITVSASDSNRGENGQVNYQIMQDQKNTAAFFTINNSTGELVTKAKLDRETQESKNLFITVRAVDRGQPPLDDYCTFPITVTDVNDNSPIFRSPLYRGTISKVASVGQNVLPVKADDSDLGSNGAIKYSLSSNPGNFFRINEDTGIIELNKSLSAAGSTVALTAVATDQGAQPRSATTSVAITIETNPGVQPPAWNIVNPTFVVKESESVNYVVGKVTATNRITNISDTGLDFSIVGLNNKVSDRDPSGHFLINRLPSEEGVNIIINKVLDYETNQEFTITIRASNRAERSGVFSDNIVKIIVEDVNDVNPEFQNINPDSGKINVYVKENSNSGTVVSQIVATDGDLTSPFNLVSFSLTGTSQSLFQINQTSGVITTRQVFDRETMEYYYVTALGVDGAPSGRPDTNGPNTGSAAVQIIIQDVNDNPPYFKQPLYTATVKEDSFIGSSIITIEASDADDDQYTTFTYTLSGSDLFDVNRRTGEIRVAGNLDYETPPNVYFLTLTVDDGIYSNRTNVNISILDTNDNSPVFDQETYVIRNITENDDYSSRPPILVVKATDPDTERDSGMEYKLAEGDSVITSLFSMDRTTGELRLLGALDRDRPNGREVYQFNVLAIDEPGSDTSLTGYATVQIHPIDVNDNKPVFDAASLTGTVPEMSPTGRTVMTIKAIDYDDGENARLTYEMVPGSQSPGDAFRVESDGSVYTTVNNLDRETNPTYTFQVIAKDHGVPSLSDTATATVNIGDINDNPPTFSQEIYKATIPETYSGRIMTITANDPDIDDILRFDLIGDSSTFFAMRPEQPKIGSLDRTGVLEVYKNPDYEIPEQRFFNLTVQVSDSENKYSDTAYIEITVLDVNDEIPIIRPSSIEVEKDENVPVNTILTKFNVSDRDADTEKNGKTDFFISGKPVAEMPNYYFSIDESGTVRVRRPLDYEKIPVHIVRILAIDRGFPPQTGTATLTVRLNDINDNPPRIRGNPYRVVMENEPAQTVNPAVFGEDPDEAPFGGPFSFSRPPCDQDATCPNDFALAVNNNGDGGNGEAVVSSLRMFDREEQKFFYMPIIMSDMRGKSNANPQTATNTLTIEIGDINDNPSQGGTQNIHVYNYKGLFGNIYIGSVHYVDKDDNDRADKTFTLLSKSVYFEVESDGGKIKMLNHVPAANHNIKVRVFDKKFKTSVTSTVNIKVEDLPEEAPFRSGSVRLTGITAAEFIRGPNSPMEKFRAELRSQLPRTPTSDVQIISVMDTVVDGVEYLDVRYAARGSPYYPASKLDGIVEKDRDKFKATLPDGAEIAMVSIDMCLREICEGGGCYNRLIVREEPNLVDTRGSSFVGVQTEVQAECGCVATTNVTECDAMYCLNGGTCTKDLWGNLHCECPEDFNGPRCQQLAHGFDGTGYALYPTLQQCENSVTSIEFVTLAANGLIMYNGPIRDLGDLDPRDYLVLQLKNGYPELTIDHGTGSLTLNVDGTDSQGSTKMAGLNDGKWHQIDIRRQGKAVTMTVDSCLAADNTEGSAQDRSPCEAQGTTKGENKFLNVNAQLQLGGRYTTPTYPGGVVDAKFRGCMRNLRHNGELYDLYTKGFYPGSTDGCPEEDNLCGKNSVNGNKCKNGICHMTQFPNPPSDPGSTVCVCHPGYRGSVCQHNTTMIDFNTNSFMDWELTNAFRNSLSTRQLDVQLNYRSRDTDGILFHVQAEASAEFMKLEIINNVVQILYNLGDGNQFLQLGNVPASDGQWHTIYVQRRGRNIVLKMDGGEGHRYTETYMDSLHQEMTVKGDQIYAGAQVSYEHSPVVDQASPKDFASSCMNDIRLEGRWFPMTTSENAETNNVKLMRSRQTQTGCVRDDCTPIRQAECSANGKICLPLWGAYTCVCPTHHEEVGQTCRPIDYCGRDSPCHHLSTCQNDASNEFGYRCICPPSMEGRICNIGKRAPVDPTPTDDDWILPLIIAIVVICVLVLLIIGLIFAYRKGCFGNGQGDKEKFMDLEKEDYDIRENIVDYDEDGAGDDDNEGYDISRLRKPADTMTRMDRPDLMATNERPLKGAPPGGQVGDFIHDRLGDADDDPDAPPYDTTREFDFEGGGSDAGSLSSLNTTTSDGDQDYDYLNNWGPKFAKLADMYNNYEDSE